MDHKQPESCAVGPGHPQYDVSYGGWSWAYRAAQAVYVYNDAATVFGKVCSRQLRLGWDIRVAVGSLIAMVYTAVLYGAYSGLYFGHLRYLGFLWDGAGAPCSSHTVQLHAACFRVHSYAHVIITHSVSNMYVLPDFAMTCLYGYCQQAMHIRCMPIRK